MATINPNAPGISGDYGISGLSYGADPKVDTAPASGAGRADGPQALTEEQLKALAALSSALNLLNTGLGLGDFGATAISLPKMESPTQMQAMSTADLLQLIRDKSRKTNDLLLATTMQSIKNLQAQIALNSKTSIANLDEAAKKQEHAEKLMKVMNIVKWAVIAVGAVACAAAVVASGGAAAPLFIALFSVAMMVTTTCLSEIKGPDGKSPMDEMMEGLGDAMEKLAKAYGDMPAWAQAAVIAGTAALVVASALLAPNMLSVTLPMCAIAVVGALPDKWVGDEMKGQIMAGIVMTAAMIVLSVAAVAASSAFFKTEATVAVEAVQQQVQLEVEQATQKAADIALKAGTETAESATQSVSKTVTEIVDEAASLSKVQDYAKRLRVGSEYLKASLQIVNSGVGIGVAADQLGASQANANVMALKEMVKMLQTLMDGDASFAQMLAQVQAQLDAGCAEVVATEHQTNENINREMFS